MNNSNLERLTNISSHEDFPTWSPNGPRLVFTSWRDGDGEIYIMDVDGCNLLKLTDNRFEEEVLTWRPVLFPHIH
jgi:TolB protein